MNVYPTGSCFEDSMQFLKTRCESEPGAWTRYLLVHAFVRGADGRVHSHSWVEDPKNNSVWTAGIVGGERAELEVDADSFRQFMGAHEITVYSLDEAKAREDACGHAPPWEDKYIRLCRDYVAEPAGSGPGATGPG